NEGRTPVMLIDDVQTLQMLYNHKADMNARDDSGRSALISEIWNTGPRHISDKARFLVLHGAKVSLSDKSGMTALDYVIDYQDKALIHLLESALTKEQAEQKSSVGIDK